MRAETACKGCNVLLPVAVLRSWQHRRIHGIRSVVGRIWCKKLQKAVSLEVWIFLADGLKRGIVLEFPTRCIGMVRQFPFWRGGEVSMNCHSNAKSGLDWSSWSCFLIESLDLIE